MGSFTSRQNAGVEEVDISSNHAYKYPPRSGNYFGSHFIMGGERFDTPQPESYLFGENADLNFLGSKPTSFPYPPPQVNEPTKALKCLVNIRRESLRFVRVSTASNKAASPTDGKVIVPKTEVDDADKGVNVEFVFDAECKCAITIYYTCQEEITPSGVGFLSTNPSLTSETYHFKKGAGQTFCQPTHICYPGAFMEDQLTYSMEREFIPVAIHCVAEEPVDEPRQSHTTLAVIDRHNDGSFGLRAFKQKIYVDGLCYLLQEIYGIENKNSELYKGSVDTDTEDNGSECVICMCDGRDTLILPCRHLCLCNSCADSLRYQANNCPICRAPFRALLQIRALQRASSTTVTSVPNADGSFTTIPAGYELVQLIEALNGPIVSSRQNTTKRRSVTAGTPDTDTASAIQAVESLNRLDSKGPTRPGETRDKVSPSSDELNTELTMSELINRDPHEGNADNSGKTSPLLAPFKRPSKKDKNTHRNSRDSVLIVNETEAGENYENDHDSEAEKLSPLLDSAEKIKNVGSPRSDSAPPATLVAQNTPVPTGAEDSDYYTPDDQGPNGLIENEKAEVRTTAPSVSAGNTPVRAPGTPLSAATSHRSSGDSFSSSSSTRQLLPPVATITANNSSNNNSNNQINNQVASNQPTETSASLQDVAMV